MRTNQLASVTPQNQQSLMLPPILDARYENTPHSVWSTLPEELLQRILDLLYDPSSFDFNALSMRLASRRFRISSDNFFSDQAPRYLAQLYAKKDLEKLFFIIFCNFGTHLHLPKLADQNHAYQGHIVIKTACGLPFSKFKSRFPDPGKNEQEIKDLSLIIKSYHSLIVEKILKQPSLSIIRDASKDDAKMAQLNANLANAVDPIEIGRFTQALGELDSEIRNPIYINLLYQAVKNDADDILRLLLDYLSETLSGGCICGGEILFLTAIARGNQEVINVLLNPKYNLEIGLYQAFQQNCLHLLIEPILNIEVRILADLYQVLEESLEDEEVDENEREGEDENEFFELGKERLFDLFRDPRLDLRANDHALFKTITEICPALARMLRDKFKIDYYEKLFEPISKDNSTTFMLHALINHAVTLSNTPCNEFSSARELDSDDLHDLYTRVCVTYVSREIRSGKEGQPFVKLETEGNDRKRRKISEG